MRKCGAFLVGAVLFFGSFALCMGADPYDDGPATPEAATENCEVHGLPSSDTWISGNLTFPDKTVVEFILQAETLFLKVTFSGMSKVQALSFSPAVQPGENGYKVAWLPLALATCSDFFPDVPSSGSSLDCAFPLTVDGRASTDLNDDTPQPEYHPIGEAQEILYEREVFRLIVQGVVSRDEPSEYSGAALIATKEVGIRQAGGPQNGLSACTVVGKWGVCAIGT